MKIDVIQGLANAMGQLGEGFFGEFKEKNYSLGEIPNVPDHNMLNKRFASKQLIFLVQT